MSGIDGYNEGIFDDVGDDDNDGTIDDDGVNDGFDDDLFTMKFDVSEYSNLLPPFI